MQHQQQLLLLGSSATLALQHGAVCQVHASCKDLLQSTLLGQRVRQWLLMAVQSCRCAAHRAQSTQLCQLSQLRQAGLGLGALQPTALGRLWCSSLKAAMACHLLWLSGDQQQLVEVAEQLARHDRWLVVTLLGVAARWGRVQGRREEA
jgi:hypothetical protein